MKDDNKEKSEVVMDNKKPFFFKNWWNKYIKRLNKITNGKPQCCK